MIIFKDDWQQAEAWDEFVERHEESRFCHLFGYANVLAVYGYKPRNICFLQNGTIVGVLPAVEVRSRLFGSRLVSQPFSEYGGLLLEPTLGSQDVGEIFELLKDYLRRHREIGLVEMHGNHGVPEPWREQWEIGLNPHHIAELRLRLPVEELWRNVVRYSVRKAVNQAEKQALTVTSECNRHVIRDLFFPLYLRSMKRLGVPPHTVDYYLKCYDLFPEKMKIFWIKRDSVAIAGLLGFCCGRRVSIINIVSDPGTWSLRPNDLVHWNFIKWAAETNHEIFDFGSVRYQGQETYKKKWGCEVSDHKFYFMVRDEQNQRPTSLNSSSQSMHAMAGLWARYMPISVGKILGPTIRKHLVR